jgi:hypothetical protein
MSNNETILRDFFFDNGDILIQLSCLIDFENIVIYFSDLSMLSLSTNAAAIYVLDCNPDGGSYISC